MNGIVEDDDKNEDKVEIEEITDVETRTDEIEDKGIEDADIFTAKLKEELEESKKRSSEYLDHLQRLQAEFDNYKKLVDRQKADLIDYACAELISELIDVMENLERGLTSAQESDDIDSVIKGMEMVYSQLRDILTSRGLEPIEAQGLKFDPYYHEAMMKTSSDEFPNNTVIEVFQRGYKIKKRVLRYAKVRVSINENNNN
jgi:molecular chaperone GrpE